MYFWYQTNGIARTLEFIEINRHNSNTADPIPYMWATQCYYDIRPYLNYTYVNISQNYYSFTYMYYGHLLCNTYDNPGSYQNLIYKQYSMPSNMYCYSTHINKFDVCISSNNVYIKMFRLTNFCYVHVYDYIFGRTILLFSYMYFADFPSDDKQREKAPLAGVGRTHGGSPGHLLSHQKRSHTYPQTTVDPVSSPSRRLPNHQRGHAYPYMSYVYLLIYDHSQYNANNFWAQLKLHNDIRCTRYIYIALDIPNINTSTLSLAQYTVNHGCFYDHVHSGMNKNSNVFYTEAALLYNKCLTQKYAHLCLCIVNLTLKNVFIITPPHVRLCIGCESSHSDHSHVYFVGRTSLLSSYIYFTVTSIDDNPWDMAPPAGTGYSSGGASGHPLLYQKRSHTYLQATVDLESKPSTRLPDHHRGAAYPYISYVYLLPYDFLHYKTCNTWYHIKQYMHTGNVRLVYTMHWGGGILCIPFAISSQGGAYFWCDILVKMTTYMITPTIDLVSANQFRLGDKCSVYGAENNVVYYNDDAFLYTVCLYQKCACLFYGVMNIISVRVITRTAPYILAYQVHAYMKLYVFDIQSKINICTICELCQNVISYQAIYQTLLFLFHMRRHYGYGPLAVQGVFGDPLVPETRRGAITSVHRYKSSTTTLTPLQHYEWTWTFSSSAASPALEGLHSFEAEILLRYFYDILSVAELSEKQNTYVLRICGCVLCLSLDWAIFSAKVPISHTSTGRTIRGIVVCEFIVVCTWVDAPYYPELYILHCQFVCIFSFEDALIEYSNFPQDICMYVYDLSQLQSVHVYE